MRTGYAPVVLLLAAFCFALACNDRDTSKPSRGPAEHQPVTAKHHKLLPVSQDWRFGYVDANGELRIPCKYESAFAFHDNVAIVKSDSGYGLIDSNDHFLLKPVYRAIVPSAPGKYFCQSEDGWDLVDVSTHERWPVGEATLIRPVRAGTSLAAFCVGGERGVDRILRGGKWGYLDATGKVAIPPRFDRALWFEGRFAWVSEDERWGLINEEGEYVVEPTLDHIEPVEPMPGWRCRFHRVRKDGKYGFIRPDGRWLMRPQFLAASQLGTQWIAVRQSKDWMFVDKDGRVRLRMADTDVPNGVPFHAFSEGLAAVRRPDGALVWIDMSGTVQIGPKKGFLPFPFTSNGVAVVWFNDTTDDATDRSALMNRSGEYVVGPLDGLIRPYSIYGALHRVMGSGQYKGLRTYVDPKGRFLWLPEGHPWGKR